MTEPFAETVDALSATAVGSGTAKPVASDYKLVRGDLVNRYVVLFELGAGGMGVVYAVHDPELDRKVALKLLHPQLDADADRVMVRDARARLVREAQALAKLNHPHIVAVYDAGEHAGAVWLAMEYVDGETLGAWMRSRRRTWREVLDVLIPTCQGLAAAHKAEIIHRDIKPDNIMLGKDGRIRLMDLGLARVLDRDDTHGIEGEQTNDLGLGVTRAGAILGTPAYMSPEQFHGQVADERADVFAICATMWEALFGQRPFTGNTVMELAANVVSGVIQPVPRDPMSRRVPRWLRRVCLRGLAVEPDNRFVSADALLLALLRGRRQARIHARLLAAFGVIAVGALGFAIQQYDVARRTVACEEVATSITDVWNPDVRAEVREGLLSTGLSYAPVTVEKVMPILDTQAQSWSKHRLDVCVAGEIEHTLAPVLVDRAIWCLEERRNVFSALINELTRAGNSTVSKAVIAAASLPTPVTCTEKQVLSAMPPPPPVEVRAEVEVVRTSLSRALAQLAAGHYSSALRITRTALVEAQALNWRPLIAKARQLEGRLLGKQGALPEAEATSLAAYVEAATLSAWGIAADAALDLTDFVGSGQARHTEGSVWAQHAKVAITLAGDSLSLRESLRLTRLANIHFAKGEYEKARALHERALAIKEKSLGSNHPKVAISLHNLALVAWATGSYSEASELYARTLKTSKEVLGPEHPNIATILNNFSGVSLDTGNYREAQHLLRQALDIRENVLGPEHPEVATTLSNLAQSLIGLHEYQQAQDLLTRAFGIWTRVLRQDHPHIAAGLHNLGTLKLATGAYSEAQDLLDQAKKIREKALGSDHPDVATSLDQLARAYLEQGQLAEAKTHFERALTIAKNSLGPDHPQVARSLSGLGILALEQKHPETALPLLERAVEIFHRHEGVQDTELEACYGLAQAIIVTNGDQKSARVLASEAADGYRLAGKALAHKLSEVEQFLVELEAESRG